MKCESAMRWMDGLLLGELTAKQWTALAPHLKTCDACAGYYDRVVLALRQFTSRSPAVSIEELRHVGEAVSRVAAPAPPSRGWALGGLFAALAAAALVVVFLPRGDAGSITPRGGATALDVSLRAYCLAETDGKLEVVAVSMGEPGQVLCRTSELVQFAYTLNADGPAWFRISGVTLSGEVLDYFPSEGGQARLEPTSAEQPIPGSIRLKARHSPGTVRIVALVSRNALSAEIAGELVRGAPPPAEVRRLELNLQVLP